MIDLKILKDNPEEIKKACQNRGIKCQIDQILKLVDKKNTSQQKLEEIRAEKNHASKQIPKLSGPEKEELIVKMKKVNGQTDKLTGAVNELDKQLEELLYQIPNIPKPDVKVGKDANENETIREYKVKPDFAFKPKDYLTLGEKLDLIDIKRAAKVSGSRFGYIKGDLALLENALLQYGIEVLTKAGFKLIFSPNMIKDEMMKGLGYIEGLEEREKYHLEKDKMYLIATGEHALTPLHADEILNNEELPKRYITFTPCYRREAGSYGKDTGGIFRVHQFEKLEMVALTRVGESDSEHEFMLSLAEQLMADLELPHRVIKMCTGDLSFPSARTYDIETWMPSQNQYRETGSISTCTDFQARRLKIRYRDKNSIQFVHTLNGTAYAMGRTLIAIMENYQTKEGFIEVPKVLRPYCYRKVIDQKYYG